MILSIGGLPVLSTCQLTCQMLTFFDGVIAWAIDEHPVKKGHKLCQQVLTRNIVDTERLFHLGLTSSGLAGVRRFLFSL